MPQPKLLAQELAEISNEVRAVFHGAPMDEGRIRNLYARTTHMLTRPVSKSMAYATLSTIQLVLGEREIAIKNSRIAINYSSEKDVLDSISFSVATSVLFACNHFREVYLLNDQWLESIPNDKIVIRSAIVQSFVLAQSEKVSRYTSMLNSIPSIGSTDMINNITAMSESTRILANSLQFAESDILDRVDVAVSAVHEQGQEVTRVLRMPVGDGSFVIRLLVNVDYAKAADLTFAVFDALSNKFEHTAMELLSFCCSPTQEFSGLDFLKDDL